MSDDRLPPAGPAPEEPTREPLEPGTHLRLSVLLYVGVNLVYGIPMALGPSLLWGDIAGADGRELDALVSNRWVGAALIAWGAGGLLVLLRPGGRQTMVTTFALQFTLAAAFLVISALADEFAFVDTWFVLLAIVVVGFGGAYLWYARWRGRAVLTDS